MTRSLVLALALVLGLARAHAGAEIGDVYLDVSLGGGARVTPVSQGAFFYGGSAGFWIGHRVAIGLRLTGFDYKAKTDDDQQAFTDTLFLFGPSVTAYLDPRVFFGLTLGVTGDYGESYAGSPTELVAGKPQGELRLGVTLLDQPWGHVYLAGSFETLETRDYMHRACRQLGLMIGVARF